MPKFSKNALTVLKKRYLLRDQKGKIVETPEQLLCRIAGCIARNKKEEKEFYKMMSGLEFLPNSPTLMNAGTDIGQLSACFVIPVEDSLQEIFEAVKDMAMIQQSGGGTGFSFSRLRPKGDIVRTTHGVASGPVSFMHVFDETTEVIKQGGKRRGANMGILSINHPDILEFITAKRSDESALHNFNISVAITDNFMEAVKGNRKTDLINPRNKKIVKRLSARKIFDQIVDSAWETGDPGAIFIDELNRKHPLRRLGKIEATNPCGEQPLLPYESCNLGSINLAKMVEDERINWEKLKRTARTAVRFLDNVIDINKYPLPQIEKNTRANRKIGLGVMGFADMLIALGIRYDSEEAVELAQKLFAYIQQEAHKMSVELGREKGSFSNFKKSSWYKKYPAMRNATVTTVAPTGSISLLAGCTSGIEPIFSLSFVKEVLGGVKLAQKYKPSEVAVSAFQVAPEWHVRMQAAFQRHTDNAVSKTVNLPASASREDVRRVFLLAHELKCKGITVYRYGSKARQVLYTEDSGESCCEI